MLRITTVCPRCGRVDLTGDEVTLVVDPHRRTACYLFDCVGCVRRVVKAVPGTVANAMSLLRISVWTVPAEVVEREQGLDAAPPLTLDDLLDTMLWLRRHDDLSDAELPVNRAAAERR
jgi:hypothetical protein